MSLKSRTWYFSETDFPHGSYLYPGGTPLEDTEDNALIFAAARKEIGNDFGGYRVETRLPSGERILARGHRVQAETTVYHTLREIPQFVPELSMPILGYSPVIQRILLEPSWVHGGLVLVSGAGGSGKSTTLASTVVSRLKTHGGVALTLEDPPEYVLSGKHGNGLCIQFKMHGHDDFKRGVADALRCYPAGVRGAILLVGEIRTTELASMVVDAALGGHLVLTTIHAMSAESAVARLCNMAASGSNREAAMRDVSEAMRAVVYQRIEHGGVRKAKQTLLVNNGDNASVASKIRDGNFHMLNADIQQQNILIARGVMPY